MTDTDTVPDTGLSATDIGSLSRHLTGKTALESRPKNTLPQVPVKITGAEDYEGLDPGTLYIAPGETEARKKPWKVSDESSYDDVPEGENYLDPQGQLRQKPAYQPISVTSQTLYDMAVNDKERRRILERSYPGKVRSDSKGEFYVEDEDGIRRKPGRGPQETAGLLLSGMAPGTGAGAGSFVGGLLGSVVPGLGTAAGFAAGAGVGGAIGQSVNDTILAVAGVYDRSAGEEAGNLALAGAFGAGGEVAGRALAGVGPGIKGAVKNVGPRFVGSALGAKPEAVTTARELAERGVSVPISPLFPESPHLINIAEVFEPAFKTQKPLLESATEHYETQGKKILSRFNARGVDPAARKQIRKELEGVSLINPTTAVPTEKVGAALLGKARQELTAADAALDAQMAQAKAHASAGIAMRDLSIPTKQAVDNSLRAAGEAIQGVFASIQEDIDAAMGAVKAGHNSGDLWWNVGEKLKQIRQAIGTRAKGMYDAADELAAGHLPNSEGLPELARNFLQQLPEGFEGRYPNIVKQLRDLGGVEELDDVGHPTGKWTKEPVTPTFGQLHNLRSILRNNINYHDLTTDVREGVYKFFAKAVDGILHDDEAVPELQLAVQMLDATDNWYSENMAPMRDRNIQAVVSGLESGLPADPKVLFDTLVREGRSDLTRKVADLVGPNLWAGVKAADIQSMLDESKTLVPGEIDGRRFVRQVEDRIRSGMLEAVHGPDVSTKLIEQAKRISALEGRIPLEARPGDTIGDVIAKARKTADAAKAAGKYDPVATLEKEMKKIENDRARQGAKLRREKRQEPLGFLYDPTVGAMEAADRILGNEDLILAAAAKFGEASPEFEMLRQVYLHRLLQGTMQPSERLAKISPEVQQLMFPSVTYKQLTTLAKEMDFLMSVKNKGDTGSSMSAMAKVEHPWSAIGGKIGEFFPKIPGGDAAMRATLGAYYTIVRKLATSPAFLRWLEKGLAGDPAARARAKAVTQQFMRYGGRAGAVAGESLYQGEGGPGDLPPNARWSEQYQAWYVSDPDRPGKYLRVDQQ